MSITQIVTQSPSGQSEFQDTAIGNSATAIKGSSALVLSLVADNTGNVAATYIKLYNLASGSVVVGTTAPDEVIFCPGSVITTAIFQTGATAGQTFGTALTVAAVNSGGTAGTTSPVSNVPLTIVYV